MLDDSRAAMLLCMLPKYGCDLPCIYTKAYVQLLRSFLRFSPGKTTTFKYTLRTKRRVDHPDEQGKSLTIHSVTLFNDYIAIAYDTLKLIN